MKVERIARAGATITYVERGPRHGEPLVLIQGLGLPGAIWAPIAEDLAAQGYRVIVPDNRGTGASRTRRAAFTLPQLAADVAAVIEHARAWPALLCGISLGGMIAQHVALLYPHHIHGLVLASTTCGPPYGPIPEFAPMKRLIDLGLKLDAPGLDEMSRLLGHSSSRLVLRDEFERWHDVLDEQPTPASTIVAQVSAASMHNTGFLLPRVRVPTHVIGGAADRIVSAKNVKILSRLIPNARATIVPNTGHVFPHERPDTLFDALDDVRERAAIEEERQRW